jgi:hypothetical protein
VYFFNKLPEVLPNVVVVVVVVVAGGGGVMRRPLGCKGRIIASIASVEEDVSPVGG